MEWCKVDLVYVAMRENTHHEDMGVSVKEFYNLGFSCLTGRGFREVEVYSKLDIVGWWGETL